MVKVEKMTRLEFLLAMYSLEALLEEGKAARALELIRKLIAEAETKK